MQMLRYIGIFIIGSVAIATLNAGPIEIGQTITGVNVGLTTTWFTTPNGNGCSAGNATCVTGSTTGYSSKNFDKNMFAADTPNPTPFTGYSNTSTTASTAGSTMADPVQTNSDAGVTFAMMSQSGTYANFWGASGNNTITIPVGVFGVESVWTMLNNYFGVTGNNDTDVTFTFDAKQNGSDATTLTTVTVDLINGTDIRSAVKCTANCGTANYANTLNTTAGGTNVTGGNLQCTSTSSQCPTLVNVVANNIYGATGLAGGTGTNWAGSTDNVMLDDQGFSFGTAFDNDYLVSMAVSQANFGASNPNASVTGIAAVTVVTAASLVATPEPSSILLLLGGLGAFGYARRFRRS
jgi:hypothetical protein